MAEHPNAVKYREIMAKLDTGDMEGMNDYLADDVEWSYIGGDKPALGKQGVMELYGRSSDVDIKVDLHDVVANDEHLIALVNVTAKRGDGSLNYRTAEIHHIKDGKITHRWAFSDDTEAINKFFG